MENMENMEQIFALMELFNNKQNKNEKGKNSMDMIIPVLGLFSNNKKGRKLEPPSTTTTLFEENYAEQNSVRTIKSSLPFLPYNHQKNLLIAIKVMEIKSLIEIYNNQNESKPFCKDDLKHMLNSLSPNLTETHQKTISDSLKMANLAEVFSNFN